ncbi:hypothetical protein [Specibacter sp. RAF43]|uniref:hypothetical protein n=1 Tax=Specibacter sp. RAF43 TaxID=3233057 RepID=UPI003F96D43B
MRALLACVALGLGAAGLAGCTAFATHFTPGPAVLQDGVDCLVPSEWRPDYGPTDPAARLMGTVPAGFVPVDVVRCREDFLPTPNATTVKRVVLAEHLRGDYAALLAALAQPSDRAYGASCTDDAEFMPNLWLVNAGGQAVHVMWPLDACGKTRGKPDTAKALAALTVASTSTLDAPVLP